MNFKRPSFWYRDTLVPPWQEMALLPFSRLYKFFYELYQKTRNPYQSFIPVVCVGNITVGGSGKTPTALSILSLVKAHKIARNPCFLTRGYGGSLRGPVFVDLQEHNAMQVGDEALLLARYAPVVVSADRGEGVRMLEGLGMGTDLVIMDDGLQNMTLHQDLKLLVVSGEKGFGNGKLLPAGPLRQTVRDGTAQADACILIGEDRRKVLKRLPKDKPVITGSFRAESLPPEDRRYVAFAGLAHPDRFFDFLKEKTPLKIVKTIPFADHYPYTEQILRKLHRFAEKKKAYLITTEKDAVRLPRIEGIEVEILPVSIHWDTHEDMLADLLQRTMKKSRA